MTKAMRLELIKKWSLRLTQKDLAREYGISELAVSGIVYRARHGSKKRKAAG